MALTVTIKKDIAFLNIIEDVEKVITLVADTLLLDLSDPLTYPALEASGEFTSSGIAAYSAQKLLTARTIELSGDVTGSVEFDGSGNVIITTTVNGGTPGAHTHVTVDITDATSVNEVSKIVKRDASGNFAANIITANLVGNVTGTASNATSALAATNVTTNINGHAISSILEVDGVTAKSATNADTLDSKHYSDILEDINSISLVNAIIFA